MKIVSLTVLPVVAVAALAACTATPAPVAAPASSAPAAATSAAAPADPATPADTADPADPAEAEPEQGEPVATTPVATKPVAAEPEPAAVTKPADWAKPMFAALACKHNSSVPDRAEIHDLRVATLAGVPLTFVTASCPTTTSTNPLQVRAYTGGPASKRLLTVGAGSPYLRTATLRFAGDTVTVTSEAISDAAPRCCPDLRIVQTHKYEGGGFERTGYSKKPL